MLLKTGEEYVIPDDLYSEFVAEYGQELVTQELSGMRMWLLSNKGKRKTKVGMPKFMNSWLARTKKTGGVSPFADVKPVNATEGSIRGRTITESICDITWVEPEEMLMMKQFYLTKYGHYYDGELRNV